MEVLKVAQAEKEAQKIVQKGMFVTLSAEENAKDAIARECMPSTTWQLAIDDLTLPLSDRTKRVKDAKSEAQKEIEEYRKKKEEEFKKFESEVYLTLLQPIISPGRNL